MLKSIVCTYPDFRSLPKGIKQMLVASENLFFEEAQVSPWNTVARDSGNRSLWPPPQKQFAAKVIAAARRA